MNALEEARAWLHGEIDRDARDLVKKLVAGLERPTIRVGTIGHVDHGKSTLTLALTRLGSRPAPEIRADEEDQLEVVDAEAERLLAAAWTPEQLHAASTAVRNYMLQCMAGAILPADSHIERAVQAGLAAAAALAPSPHTLSLAEIRNGTGFERGARFVQVAP